MRRLQTPKISRKTESLKTLDVVGIDAQFKGYRNRQNYGKKKASVCFGGIPNSRNVLFLQIFLKGAAKPSAGNTSAGFPWIKWPQILLNLTWLCTKASPDLLRNLLQNPVEPDLALHQSLPEPSLDDFVTTIFFQF